MVPSIEMILTHVGDYVVFMDLVIFKGDRFYESGLLDIKVYQKELNIYSYIPFNSNHPKHVFKNFVLGEIKRYIRFNSSEFHFWKMIKKNFRRLRNRGYPRKFLRTIFDGINFSERTSLLFPAPKANSSGRP